MHTEQQSVRTIYGNKGCFRNDDNDLRVAALAESCGLSSSSYVTAQSDSGHGPVDEPRHNQNESQPGLPLAVLHVEVEAKAAFLVPVGCLPGRGPWHKCGHVRGIGLICLGKSPRDVGAFP